MPRHTASTSPRRLQSSTAIEPKNSDPILHSAMPEGLSAGVFMVTPAWAAWMLANHNPNNRFIATHTVDEYAREIDLGSWDPGIPIAIDHQGNLADGQHRLAAIVQSNTPVRMMVLHGVSDAFRIHIDRGRKRTAAFQLALSGMTGHTARVSAVARLLIDMDGAAQSDSMRLRYAERFSEDIMWAVHLFGTTSGDPLARAPVMAAFAFARPIDREKIESFAQSVKSLIGLRPGSPALLLTTYLRSTTLEGKGMARGTLSARDAVMKKTLYAIQAHLEGDRPKTLPVVASIFSYFREQRAAMRAKKKRAS